VTEADKRLRDAAPELRDLLQYMIDVGDANNCADDGVRCNGCGIALDSWLQKPHREDCAVERARKLLASLQPKKEPIT